MRKVLNLMIVLNFFLFPFLVFADSCNKNQLIINSVTLSQKSDNLVEVSQPNISNSTINLNIKIKELNDFVVYKISVTNHSNNSYRIDNNIDIESNYLDYFLNSEDNSNIIKANSKKNFYLRIEYSNEIPNNTFDDGTYISNKSFSIPLFSKNIVNPNTGFSYYLLLFVLFVFNIGFLFILKYKKSIMVLVFIILFIPIYVYAICSSELVINSNIKIIENSAEFLSGKEVNSYMKRIAGNDNPTYESFDNNITALERVDELNPSYESNDYLVSTKNSTYPIYMWYEKNADNDQGVIKWYSKAKTIYFNKDASFMFQRLGALEEFISKFNTSKTENMEGLFFENQNIVKLDVSSFDTSNVTNMKRTFASMPKLRHLDIRHLNTENVVNFNRTFAYLSILEELDLSNLNTSKATDMGYMFRSSGNLTELDLSSFDTSNVIDMEYMFCNDRKLKRLNILSFNTKKLEKAERMFYDMQELEELDISSFSSENINSFFQIFSGNLKLKTIYVSPEFDLSTKTLSDDIFGKDNLLVGGNNTSFISSNKSSLYARIDRDGTPGYFTLKS